MVTSSGRPRYTDGPDRAWTASTHDRSRVLAATHDGKHVLVVDDDSAILNLVELWLTEAGYDVATCNAFDRAKQQLAQSTPDILLTDVRLGAFNGLQLVILAKEQDPHMITAVMSAYDDPLLRKEASRCGARYVLKPFTYEQILDSVSQAAAGGTAVET